MVMAMLSRPFRATASVGFATRGVAPGWYVGPLRGGRANPKTCAPPVASAPRVVSASPTRKVTAPSRSTARRANPQSYITAQSGSQTAIPGLRQFRNLAPRPIPARGIPRIFRKARLPPATVARLISRLLSPIAQNPPNRSSSPLMASRALGDYHGTPSGLSHGPLGCPGGIGSRTCPGASFRTKGRVLKCLYPTDGGNDRPCAPPAHGDSFGATCRHVAKSENHVPRDPHRDERRHNYFDRSFVDGYSRCAQSSHFVSLRS